MKLPIRTLGLAAAALLIGSALAPASAQQQQSGVDGQVALRSDGALYLITNGQRRWISTVAATDEEINRLPEGEPIYAGLAPQGASQGASQASVGPTKPSTSSASTPSKPAPKTTTTKPSTSGDDDDDDDGDSNSELSQDIPISVDIGGEERIKRGDTREVIITTSNKAVCDLVIQIPGDDDIVEDSRNPDSRGRCRYTIEIPGDADTGSGKIIGTAREGGKMNKQEINIRVVR